ncbi:phosphoribosylanthranilate isomerase, partial [Kibdelosporangium lantanae]
TVTEARELADGLDLMTVGVFAKMPAVEAGRIAREAGLDAVQLHGDYPREAFAELSGLDLQLIRATPLTADTDVTVGGYGEDMLLLDSPTAGSGETWDLSALGHSPEGRWILAGGLTPENVGKAIAAVRPWGVDVSSGVESSRGVKDHGLIHEFVAAARA